MIRVQIANQFRENGRAVIVSLAHTNLLFSESYFLDYLAWSSDF